MLCWLLGLIGLTKSKKRESNSDDQNGNTSDRTVNVDSVQTKQTIRENPDFCPNCGTSLNEREPVQYCPYCGVTVGKVNTIQA